MKEKKIDFQSVEELETPYLRARQEFDRLIGEPRVQAANWRRAFFASMTVLAISVFGIIYQSTKSNITPYVVEVDTSGAVRLVGKAHESKYLPGISAIKHFLSEFVIKTRSIPIDPIVMRKNFLDAYNFVTPVGSNELDTFARQSEPFSKVGKTKVAIEIESVLKIGEKTYQVEWLEKEYGPGGHQTRQEKFIGSFDLKFKKPKTEEMLLVNPLGIFIDFFSVSKKLY